jgi:hypothetical protein
MQTSSYVKRAMTIQESPAFIDSRRKKLWMSDEQRATKERIPFI